jgi:hypothetical protein
MASLSSTEENDFELCPHEYRKGNKAVAIADVLIKSLRVFILDGILICIISVKQ